MSLPDMSLSCTDMAAVRGRLRTYQARYTPYFGRRELRGHARAYLQGLLSDEPRKSFERMVLRRRGAGANTVRTQQLFLRQARWDDAPILAAHRELVATTLGEAEGVPAGYPYGLRLQFFQGLCLAAFGPVRTQFPSPVFQVAAQGALDQSSRGNPDLLPVSMRPGQPIGESVNDGHQVLDQLGLWQ